jgi:hypothetical protein
VRGKPWPDTGTYPKMKEGPDYTDLKPDTILSWYRRKFNNCLNIKEIIQYHPPGYGMMSHSSVLVCCLGFVTFSSFITQNLSSKQMVVCLIMLHKASCCSYNNVAIGSLNLLFISSHKSLFLYRKLRTEFLHETWSQDTGAALFTVMKAAKRKEPILLSAYWLNLGLDTKL